jgi:tetratricopeptide (TPR) repeat protein
MKRTLTIFLLVLITFAGCSKKKHAAIEPPVQEPPPNMEPQPAPQPQPAPPTQPPKRTLEAPAPKKRAASPGDTSAIKLVEGGVKQMNAGNLDMAEQIFEQAVRVSPNNGRPYYYLGVLSSKQKQYERASGFLSQAEVHLHDDPFWMSQILLQEGLILKAQNQKDAAIQKFREAVSTDPTNTYAQSELAALTKR